MGFRYDFDMCSMFPEGEEASSVDAAQTAEKRPRCIAMFRDPKLVKALRNADGDVQQVFTEAGFALNVHDSGAPSGHYPAHHEAARTDCIKRLTHNLRKLPKHAGRNWNGFEMAAFTQSIVKALPIEPKPLKPREPKQAERTPPALVVSNSATASPPPKLARIVALMGLTVGTGLMLFSLAGAMV